MDKESTWDDLDYSCDIYDDTPDGCFSLWLYCFDTAVSEKRFFLKEVVAVKDFFKSLCHVKQGGFLNEMPETKLSTLCEESLDITRRLDAAIINRTTADLSKYEKFIVIEREWRRHLEIRITTPLMRAREQTLLLGIEGKEAITIMAHLWDATAHIEGAEYEND